MSLISWIKNLFAKSEPTNTFEDASGFAPYKVEPAPTGRVDMTSTWPFPSQEIVAADKPGKQKKPAGKKAPAKPKSCESSAC